jgi:hypothetical protein
VVSITSRGHARKSLVWILALTILTGGALLAAWPGSDTSPSVDLEQTVTRSLGQDALNTPARLVRTTMTAWGDFSIEFVIREQGDAQANRAAALADALAITRAVYQAPPPRPLNVTLLGVWRPSPTATSVPLLYASVPADRLVGLGLTRVQPTDLAALGMVRWLPTGLCQAWQDCGAGLFPDSR